MNTAPLPQLDSDEQPPIFPEIIRTVQGAPRHRFNASDKRFHASLVNGIIDDHHVGVVVTVINSDGSVNIYPMPKFTLEPH